MPFNLDLIERVLHYESPFQGERMEACSGCAELRHAFDNALVMHATRNGVIRTHPGDFAPHQRVAILVLPEDDDG